LKKGITKIKANFDPLFFQLGKVFKGEIFYWTLGFIDRAEKPIFQLGLV